MSDRDHRFYVTWDEFYRDARALGWRLKAETEWKGMVAITRGGLVPSAIIAREIGVRLIDTFCVESYGDEDDQQTEAEILKVPTLENGGEGWLVVDDLSDDYWVNHRAARSDAEDFYCQCKAPGGESDLWRAEYPYSV